YAGHWKASHPIPERCCEVIQRRTEMTRRLQAIAIPDVQSNQIPIYGAVLLTLRSKRSCSMASSWVSTRVRSLSLETQAKSSMISSVSPAIHRKNSAEGG